MMPDPTRVESRVRHRWRLTLACLLVEVAFIPGVPTIVAWLLEGVIVEERVDGEWRRVGTAQDILDRVDPAEVEA